MLLACAAFVVAGVGEVVGATPAAAATRVEVDAGYAGGNYVPGRSVPVRVSVASDRLLQGELRVEIDVPGENVPVVVPLEVAGGNAKTIVVALPTQASDDDLQIVASIAGASASTEVQFDDDVELIGLLPGVVEETPPPTPVRMDLGTARFGQIDEATLAAPGALGSLGTLVAGPDGLTDLDDGMRRNVLTWLDEGGRLVVDSAVGDPVVGLPDEWQPDGASRVAAGRGEVRAVDGAVSRGRWAELAEPTALLMPPDGTMRGQFINEEVSRSLAGDSGLELPGVRALIVFLVAYVLLAGPVTYVLIRRKRRPNLAWIAIGAVAAVFTGTAFVGGHDIRSNTQAAHASYVETGPAGARSFSYLGLISPSGTDPTIRLPGDWTASGYVSPWMDGMVEPGITAGPRRVELQGDAVVSPLGLQAGGYGLMTAWGPVDDTVAAQGLEVSATTTPDGTVRGTLRNTTDVALHHTLVLVGTRSWDGGGLAPDQEVEWSLAPGAGEPSDPWGPVEEPWQEFTGWNGRPARDAPVDYALWSQRRSDQNDPNAPGWVTAAGWTRSWRPPVEVDDTLGGRTVFTTRAPIAAAAGPFPSDAVRRQVLRSEHADGEADDGFGPPLDVVARFSLPAGADPATPLEVELESMVRAVEVWRDGRWTAVACEVGGGFDPGAAPSPCALPAGVVDDGAVHLRLRIIDDPTSSWPGARVGAVL